MDSDPRAIRARYAHYRKPDGTLRAAPGTAVEDIHTLLDALTARDVEIRHLRRAFAGLPEDLLPADIPWTTGDAARDDIPFADRYSLRERAFLREQAEAEAVLAEALGYTHDPQYGWGIGGHTVVTLAMEARRRGVKPVTP